MPTERGSRKGYELVGLMVSIVATGLLVVPLTRWYISMTSGTEGLQDKLAMQAIIQDHWLTLNDEGFDELSAAIATKGSTWTENVGEGGRYTITTSFGDAGKYVNAACTDGAPGADERQCRKVSVQIKDNVTGQTQALNLTKVASQTDKRLKDLEARSTNLEGRVAQEEAWSGNFNSRISANESRFGQYYTKAEADEKMKQNNGLQVVSTYSNDYEVYVYLATGRSCQYTWVSHNHYEWLSPYGSHIFQCFGATETVVANYPRDRD